MSWTGKRPASSRTRGRIQAIRLRPFAEFLEPRALLTVSAHVSLTSAAAAIQGPKVVSVRRFGFHATPTTLVVAFNQALNAASAQNAFNYAITTPTRGTVLVQSAVYNAKAHTVTLQTVVPLGLRATYGLTIVGTRPSGVKGATGGFLDGAGKSGTNYVTTINAANLVVTDPANVAALKTAEIARKKAAGHAGT